MYATTKGNLTLNDVNRMVGERCVAALDEAEWLETHRVLPGQDDLDCNDDAYLNEYCRTTACVPADDDENCCTLAEYAYVTTAQVVAEQWPDTYGFEIY